MDLIHPHAKADVVEASARRTPTGSACSWSAGRRHIDKGNPSEVDAELWTTQLDRLVAHEPAEMVAVVEAGMRAGDLAGGSRTAARSGRPTRRTTRRSAA